jgi:hypothetical protein
MNFDTDETKAQLQQIRNAPNIIASDAEKVAEKAVAGTVDVASNVAVKSVGLVKSGVKGGANLVYQGGQEVVSFVRVDFIDVIKQTIKYLLQGIAVAISCWMIPKNIMEPSEIALIALVAAASFAILDMYSPLAGDAMRRGAGFGIGASLVGWTL